MLSENTTILMANGEIKDIANVTANSYVMCADGSAARVINVTQGYQKIYNIQQKTKHRAFEGEPGRLDPRRRTVYQRLALQCTAGHKLSVRVPTKPLLEKSGRNATKYKVRWRNLQQCQTLDGRIIIIPKNHHKTFPMTVEGEFAAKRFIEEMERSKGEYFNFDIEVRDLDYLDAQLRISSCIRFGPVLTGNGVLSKFLTGRSDLVTPAVKSMAWMLGLWLGDGTTKEPEISVDSLDLPVVHERMRKPPEDHLPGAFFLARDTDRFRQDKEERRMLDNTRLRIAIQKSGRLSDDSRELLARCGIKINLHTQRLIAMAENMPIDILRVRDDDIPGLVMDGVVDLGIIGENVLEEELLNRRAQGEDPRYLTLRRLDFGGCRLSLATPVDEAWDGPAALDGKRIATSYPHLLKRYLDQKGVSFKSCLLNGSVEVAPRAGLADAICDLVSTGATLEANGLREVEVIYRSKACLIQRDGEMAQSKQELIDKLLTRIQGVIQARESKYIMMHAPSERLEEVIALLPGAERPTILPLAGEQQRVAMHMVSSETLFWETMEKLKALGASSILVLPIEKMME
ncbi:hypothetical protein SCY_0695 [Saccharomyces cerevisiae YJM789]|nr:hypothetical protein SCY_0695 [Saccharomyces cerevisiae YJM789]